MEKKRISLIAAMSENKVIGKNNRLPWKMPADWQHFHEVTSDKPFIMGRNSYDAPDRLLSTRLSVILSKHEIQDLCKNCVQAASLGEAMDILKEEPDIFILGGARVFRQSMSLANYMYLTIIHAKIEGDALFPEYDINGWKMVRNDFHHSDTENPYDYSFQELIRIS